MSLDYTLLSLFTHRDARLLMPKFHCRGLVWDQVVSNQVADQVAVMEFGHY